MKVRATITWSLEYEVDPSTFDSPGDEFPTTEELALACEEERLAEDSWNEIIENGEMTVDVEKINE